MKNILLSLAFLACTHAYAQINVGSSELSQGNAAGKLSKDDMTRLKGTTTLFVLQDRDYAHAADFEKTISQAWKITPFKIIKQDEIFSYAEKGGYSFFSFGGHYTEKSGKMGNRLFSVHLSYDLWIPKITKKGTLKVDQLYSRIILSQDAKSVWAAHTRYGHKFEEKMMEYIYQDAMFDNWGAGFLKSYLITVNSILQKDELRGRFTSDEDAESLKALKKDTLYVPDYLNVHFNPYTGRENENDKDDKTLAETYSHPVKMLPGRQINEMLINNPAPIHYLIYVHSASDKFVNVYNSEKGLLFSRYTPISYNFKYKDLKKVDRLVSE